MSDLAEAGGGPQKKTINGQEAEFAELNFYDRKELIREYRKQKRDALKALLDECGMDPAQRYSELRVFDEETVGQAVWAEFLMSDEGRFKILERSLKKSGKGQESLAGSITMDGDEVLQLCAAVSHTKLKSRNDAGAGGAANPTGQGTTKAYGQE